MIGKSSGKSIFSLNTVLLSSVFILKPMKTKSILIPENIIMLHCNCLLLNKCFVVWTFRILKQIKIKCPMKKKRKLLLIKCYCIDLMNSWWNKVCILFSERSTMSFTFPFTCLFIGFSWDFICHVNSWKTVVYRKRNISS